ncbi:uncharacterized protein G2W53_044554 [Senna tora]|uniref:Uncharacterized protein n=1 Tax=Senna tora TaxID=362788 RepID=A0A834SBY4_9FABA|nr:uncharacterized protein G2W53_044554 [Senna tora]
MKQQADAADRMLQHNQGETGDRPQEHRARDGDYHGWAEFQKAKPQTFRGEFNPTLAEEWIQEFDKLLKGLRCSDEQKVEYTISILVISVRNQKEIEFMQMKQGNMPFEEIIAKYEELSKFSSYLKHNADEARKAKHVTTALSTVMRNVISPLDIKNYVELVKRHRIVARNIKVAEKLTQGTNFSNRRQMNFSKGGSSKGKEPMSDRALC